MNVQQSDIVLLRFPFSGGEPGKVRPALVVQCDRNNKRLANTIVAMITRTTTRAMTEPTQMLIDLATTDGEKSGLVGNSAVKCENLYTVRQDVVHRKIGYLTEDLMSQVKQCIKASLDLE